jgi:hypothetical protein
MPKKQQTPLKKLPPMPISSEMLTQQPTSGMEKSPEEMRKEIEEGFLDVQNRNASLDSQKLINDKQIEEIRAKTIQSLFMLLQSAGVDVSNLESISAFLQKLEAQDPDLAQLFEIAFDGLVGNKENEETPTVPGQADNTGMMERFKNLAPMVMRPKTSLYPKVSETPEIEQPIKI